MRRLKFHVVLTLILAIVLSGCSSPKLGGADRKPMTSEDKLALYDEIQSNSKSERSLYSEEGVIVTSDYRIEVETWKLNKLAEAYSAQNPFDYVKSTEEHDLKEGEWMSGVVKTADFTSTVSLYGDDEQMTLEVQLDEESAGKYVIAPEAVIINGVVKVKSLFKASEPEKGRFLITANMKDFDELGKFGLNMSNISSVAWYLGAIDVENNKMESFLIASAFPDDYTWEGLVVSETFAAAGGLVMWILHDDDYSYLCVFNGSELKIESDIEVTASSGQLISDTFKIGVNSGEFVYQQVGFNLAGVAITSGENILIKE